MDDDVQSWFATPLSMLLFCGAVAIFLLGYIPEAKKARECEAKVEEANMRIRKLAMQEMRARKRIAELAAGDPVAVEEAIREVLRLGGRQDFLPRE